MLILRDSSLISVSIQFKANHQSCHLPPNHLWLTPQCQASKLTLRLKDKRPSRCSSSIASWARWLAAPRCSWCPRIAPATLPPPNRMYWSRVSVSRGSHPHPTRVRRTPWIIQAIPEQQLLTTVSNRMRQRCVIAITNA